MMYSHLHEDGLSEPSISMRGLNNHMVVAKTSVNYHEDSVVKLVVVDWAHAVLLNLLHNVHPNLSFSIDAGPAFASLLLFVKEGSEFIQVKPAIAVNINQLERFTNLLLIEKALVCRDSVDVGLIVEEAVLCRLH